MSATTAGYIGMISLLVLLFLRIPIAFVMLFVGTIGYCLVTGWSSGISIMGRVPFTNAASYELVVIPLFMLMGYLFLFSGASSDLYTAMYKWMGKIPGGLGVATIVTAAAFSCICGSTAATIATVGAVALPEMKRYGYDDGIATGVVAASANLGILIPPSVILVVYGLLSEQSIGRLFMAGFVPGIILAFLLILTLLIMVRMWPHKAPRSKESFTLKDKLTSLKSAWVVIVLFCAVVIGIYTGIFTATEAAAVGAFLAFVIALAKRSMNFKAFTSALMMAVQFTGIIFTGMAGAGIFGYFLAITQIPMNLANWIAGTSLPPNLLLSFILVVMFLLGMFIEAMSLIILMIPIIYPVIITLGFDPVWFGVIVVIIAEMGLITPPVAGNVFQVANVAKIPIPVVYKGVAPYIITMVVMTGLMIAFPQVAMYLPNRM